MLQTIMMNSSINKVMGESSIIVYLLFYYTRFYLRYVVKFMLNIQK